MKEDLNDITCTDGKEKVKWVLEKSRQFIVKSLYIHITYGGVVSSKMQKLWDSKVPIKVKIFLWQAYQNIIQTADQLKKKRVERRSQVCSVWR